MAKNVQKKIEGLLPWERKDTDTPKSYEAFKIYCFQLSWLADTPDKKRSLDNLARIIGHEDMSTVKDWSRTHDWQNRVQAYEDWRSSQQITLYDETAAEFTKWQIRQATELLATVGEALRQQAQKLKGDALLGVATAKDLDSLMRSVKLWDDMGRRLANLPLTNIPAKAETQEDDEQIFVIGGD